MIRRVFRLMDLGMRNKKQKKNRYFYEMNIETNLDLEMKTSCNEMSYKLLYIFLLMYVLMEFSTMSKRTE